MQQANSRADSVWSRITALVFSIAAAGIGFVGTVRAQTAPSAPAAASDRPDDALEDIIVTARRRDETSMAVPVTITGINEAELSRRSITDLEGIARTVPQLVIANAAGSIQGGAVALRGISAGDSNPFGDQAVAFNIDGVQVARATPRRLAEVDMEQVEVLKGPQALYFGKNSPGGIVVIHSADPTPHFESRASIGYEPYGGELRSEGYVSGPVTDTLGVRVAAYGSRLDGYADNVTTPSALYGPEYGSVPHDREYGGRITLKYAPGADFSARFKFAYGSLDSAGLAQNTQRVACPGGVSQFGGPDDCKANDTVVRSGLGPLFQTVLDPRFQPNPFANQTQILSGLDLQYAINDKLLLSSQTGFYRSRLRFAENFTATDSQFPTAILPVAGFLGIQETSEELRLTTTFNGPLNFMAGGYYQDSRLHDIALLGLNALSPIYLGLPLLANQNGAAYSGFGSATFKPISTIEISGGARYSYEKKHYIPMNYLTGGPYNPALPGGTLKPNDDWSNVSPEATISWRPNTDLTVFTGYRTGFLSGGFNAGQGNQGADRSYDQQTVKGFEGGIKARLFRDTVRANFSAYTYKINGQQVTSLVGVSQVVTNAAASRTKGIEADAVWNTPVPGFNLHGGISYNRARYLQYLNAPCYAGQTPVEGCNLIAAAGAFTAQDLSGAALPRAPTLGGSIGASYEVTDSHGTLFGFSVDANGTSGYFTDPTDKPVSFQSSYWLLDASARVELAHGVEFALIGRNLTNEYYFQRSVDLPLTGSGTGTAAGLGANTVADVSRGRELLLRLSVQFDALATTR